MDLIPPLPLLIPQEISSLYIYYSLRLSPSIVRFRFYPDKIRRNSLSYASRIGIPFYGKNSRYLLKGLPNFEILGNSRDRESQSKIPNAIVVVYTCENYVLRTTREALKKKINK